MKRLLVEATELLISYRPELADSELGMVRAALTGGDQALSPLAEDLQSVAAQFESLGGAGILGGFGFGCEFGFFQRHANIEPLGLLRWSNIDPEDLIRGLANEFEGVGAPESTVMRIHAQADWAVTDTVYNIRCDHTHLLRESVPEAEAKQLICRRTRFLAENLIDDLRAGEKIFVYRVFGWHLPMADVLRLSDTMRRFGSPTLLFVYRAGPDHMAGSVVKLADDLLIGYIERFGSEERAAHPDDPDNFKGWEAVCRAALAVKRAGEPVP